MPFLAAVFGTKRGGNKSNPERTLLLLLVLDNGLLHGLASSLHGAAALGTDIQKKLYILRTVQTINSAQATHP
jgi:hypothetical protein